MKIFLKLKIWRIESSIKRIVSSKGLKPYIWSFGAYYIDPKHLVFVIGVPTDKNRDDLKSDANFINELKSLLVKFNWPQVARSNVAFDIESQETVDRENEGNWWYHYK